MITNTPALRPCNGLIGREKETKKRSHEKHEQSPKLGQNELLVRLREREQGKGSKDGIGDDMVSNDRPFSI